jgi:hypothetical protein
MGAVWLRDRLFCSPLGLSSDERARSRGGKGSLSCNIGGRSLPARVIRTDAYKDLALIKVEVAKRLIVHIFFNDQLFA